MVTMAGDNGDDCDTDNDSIDDNGDDGDTDSIDDNGDTDSIDDNGDDCSDNDVMVMIVLIIMVR